MQIEKEVFCECGAWKNFDDLEEFLTLIELSELYDAAIDRQNRLIKTIGAAMGVSFEENDSGTDSRKLSSDYRVFEADEWDGLGFGLGYEVVETRAT